MLLLPLNPLPWGNCGQEICNDLPKSQSKLTQRRKGSQIIWFQGQWWQKRCFLLLLEPQEGHHSAGPLRSTLHSKSQIKIIPNVGEILLHGFSSLNIPSLLPPQVEICFLCVSVKNDLDLYSYIISSWNISSKRCNWYIWLFDLTGECTYYVYSAK